MNKASSLLQEYAILGVRAPQHWTAGCREMCMSIVNVKHFMDRGEGLTLLGWKEWIYFSQAETVEFDREVEVGIGWVDEAEGHPTQRALGFRRQGTPVPPPFWKSSPTGRQAVSM